MSAMQRELIHKARQLYDTIYPCGSKSRLEDCFTHINGKYVLWFNTPDHSTHVVMSEAPAVMLAESR